MRTLIATITLTESGSVNTETYVDPATYSTRQALSTYGSPWLGQFDTSEDWRAALGRYVAKTAGEVFSLRNCHGERLVYVDEACSIYVYEIEFDS